MLGAVCSPLLVIFGNIIPYRMAMVEARSEEERRRIKFYFYSIYAVSFGLSTLITAALYLVLRYQYGNHPGGLEIFQGWFVTLVIIYLLAIFTTAVATARNRRA